jgi:hypothetical protein
MAPLLTPRSRAGASDDALQERHRDRGHQVEGDGPIHVGGVAVTTSFGREDVKPLGQHGDDGLERPRFDEARMEDDERLARPARRTRYSLRRRRRTWPCGGPVLAA